MGLERLKYWNKFQLYLLLYGMWIVIALSYGFVHDFISVSLSVEFYEYRNWERFDLLKYYDGTLLSRYFLGVSCGLLGGFRESLAGGLVLPAICALQKEPITMFRTTIQVYFIYFLTTSSTTFLGFLVGLFLGSEYPNEQFFWNVPEGVTDTFWFITIDTMHIATDVGVLLGLIVSVLFAIRKVRKQ